MNDDKLKELEVRVIDLNYRVKSVEFMALFFNNTSLFIKNNKAILFMSFLIILSIFISHIMITKRLSIMQGNINKYTKSVFIKKQGYYKMEDNNGIQN